MQAAEVSTTRSLVPRSRCSTNKIFPLVEQAEPLGEAVVETPHAEPANQEPVRVEADTAPMRALPLVEQAEPLGEAVVETTEPIPGT